MRWRAVLFLAFWLVSGLFVGTGAIAANPAPDLEEAFVGRAGDERAAAGLGRVAVSSDLVDVARNHAEEMKRQQRLHHNPRLQDDVQGWQTVGENVGVGSSVEEVHRAFMASQSHRDIILGATFTEVGVGVITDGPDFWVVQVFRKPAAAAEPGPAPSSGSGEIRAASAGSTSHPAAPPAAPPPASSPAGSVTPSLPATATATAAVLGATATEGPASSVQPDAMTDGPRPLDDPTATAPGPSVAGRAGADRAVTLPVALAATMLVLVVAGLAVHVGSASAAASPAGVARRRTSALDLWELALAR